VGEKTVENVRSAPFKTKKSSHSKTADTVLDSIAKVKNPIGKGPVRNMAIFYPPLRNASRRDLNESRIAMGV
jgi:hypothetical protein